MTSYCGNAGTGVLESGYNGMFRHPESVIGISRTGSRLMSRRTPRGSASALVALVALLGIGCGGEVATPITYDPPVAGAVNIAVPAARVTEAGDTPVGVTTDTPVRVGSTVVFSGAVRGPGRGGR